MTILVYPPGHETLPIALFTIMANSPTDVVSALSIIIVVMTLLPSLFIAGFVGEPNIIQVKIVGKGRVLTPWGELVCNTKGQEGENAYLFFRPHQAKIDDSGHCYGTMIHRDFASRVYKYCISTSGIEFKLQDQTKHDIGKFIKFSIRKMDILFF